jgi:hypothetical protein
MEVEEKFEFPKAITTASYMIDDLLLIGKRYGLLKNAKDAFC